LSTCLDGNSTLFIQANLKSCKFLSWLIVNVKAQIATVVRKLLWDPKSHCQPWIIYACLIKYSSMAIQIQITGCNVTTLANTTWSDVDQCCMHSRMAAIPNP
jgi:hypothetical protein